MKASRSRSAFSQDRFSANVPSSSLLSGHILA